MTDNLDIVMMLAGLFGLMLGLVTGMKKRGNRRTLLSTGQQAILTLRRKYGGMSTID